MTLHNKMLMALNEENEYRQQTSSDATSRTRRIRRHGHNRPTRTSSHTSSHTGSTNTRRHIALVHQTSHHIGRKRTYPRTSAQRGIKYIPAQTRQLTQRRTPIVRAINVVPQKPATQRGGVLARGRRDALCRNANLVERRCEDGRECALVVSALTHRRARRVGAQTRALLRREVCRESAGGHEGCENAVTRCRRGGACGGVATVLVCVVQGARRFDDAEQRDCDCTSVFCTRFQICGVVRRTNTLGLRI